MYVNVAILTNRGYYYDCYQKQTMFAHLHQDGKYRWNFEADDAHLMHLYSRMKELETNCKVALYLTQHPDAAHQPIENVITAFRDGFNEEGLLDSHLPGLSTVLTKLPGSRESFFAERMGIEAMSRDLGDPNVFLTMNMDPRANPEVRRLIYQLEYGTDMPQNHPFERDTETFTQLMSKYAAHVAVYLYRRSKIFLKAFLCDLCGVPDDEPDADWLKRDRTDNGWYWSRAEFTETRGVVRHLLI